MKILLIHQYFLEENDPGGSRFNEMTKLWYKEGHQITVLAGMMHYNGKTKREEYRRKYFVKKQQGNIDVIRCHTSELYNVHFLGRLWGYFSFMFSCMYAGVFKVKDKHDIIIVTSPPLFVGISAYVISKVKKVPFLFEIRDLWPESAIDTGVLQNKIIIKLAYGVESFLYKKAVLINVLTPAFRKHLIIHKNIPDSKIIFIPNSADFSLSEELLKSFNVNDFRKSLGIENKFVIIYVGAHGIANHLEQILEAAELLKDTPVEFFLIGDGMRKEALIEMAMRKKIKNVRFLNSVPKKEVFKYILASDMGTSVLKKVDTFKTIYSNKTFDYMSCKKPILMAIDGVSRELLEEADAGIYVEPENPEAFNTAVRYYLENPSELKRQGENGYSFACENFDRILLAKKYLTYIHLISKKT
jgi:glycosyltransferase involved in cell wall biosynthesis